MNGPLYTVSILTLGCRVNQYESDAFMSELKKNGCSVVPFGDECDAAIINTCTVTAESDRKSRQMIRRASAFAKHVIVTGCYAQIAAEEASSIDGVSYVCGNSGKSSLADTVMQVLSGSYNGEINSVTPPTSPSSARMTLDTPMRTRSYIKIEDGCDNKCSYCIISTARGPVRSKPHDAVIEEARILSKDTHELILTGIEAASYGMDFEARRPFGHALADLICDVDKIDDVSRIGLGSLDPTVMSDYFVGKVSVLPKLLPHFHLSIQSGSTKILAAMRRKYTSEMALSAIGRMKKALPGVTFSCDIIVGFPGETEEYFAETVEFCRKVRFLHLHIFPYSKRKGTEAAEMDCQVPENTKHERAAELDKIGRQIKSEILADYVRDHSRESESPVFVLTEKTRSGIASGHSEHFVEVKIRDCYAKIGEIVPVYLESTDGEFCFGMKA
ncbi:MAG: tRNA (N(6)-L-threonylcarbamoyladenosine(37)-C(2))-methylthiotransferase MtaB [bacterium]|nr:tRNA (N(6)-L-threonylcarbamoyladenosine(37)-C(2))-methylthiotransferase MtaB [bacterium]